MLPGEFYHIYNHAIGSEKLFRDEQNYYFFLDKVNFYLTPIVKIHAYCLLPNHFHFLIEIRKASDLITAFKLDAETQPPLLEKKISKCFSNMFNGYTQAYNKLYLRMGGLFMQNLKQKQICDMEDYTKVVRYIHINPVHHGLCKKIDNWKFSSYQALLSDRKTLLERDYLLATFGGRDAFIQFHEQSIELKFDLRL